MLHLRRWKDMGDNEAHRLLVALAGPQAETADAALAAASHMYLETSPPRGPITDDLTLWLGRGVPDGLCLNENEIDRLCRRIAEADEQRGYQILEALLTDPRRTLHWNPLRRSDKRSYWGLLLERESLRALEIAFDAAVRWGSEGVLLCHALRRGLDPGPHREMMLEFLARGEAEAAFIASCLEPSLKTMPREQAFWSVARELIRAHPLPGSVSRGLIGSMLLGPTSRTGTEADYRLLALDWARRRAVDEGHPAVQAWLRTLIGELEGRPVPHVIWEYDLPREEFLAMLGDPDSPDHRWALERLLREADWDEARQHVSLEDLRRFLPELDLPPRKKQALETALEVWTRLG